MDYSYSLASRFSALCSLLSALCSLLSHLPPLPKQNSFLLFSFFINNLCPLSIHQLFMNDYLKRAIKDRYIALDAKEEKVVYLPHAKERNLDNPEEKVQLETFLSIIYNYGYPAHKIKVCEKIQIGSSTREGDIIIYKDDDCKDPFIIVECKKRKVSNSIFEDAINQGFSYAAVSNAEYVWATSGDRDAVYQVWHDTLNERERNQLVKIPKYEADEKRGYLLKRKLQWFVRHPIISDMLMYATLMLVAAVILSKVAVFYNAQIWEFLYSFLKKPELNYNWIYNGVIIGTALSSILLGSIFMRSHHFFKFSTRRKLFSYLMIAVILFLPSWWIGISNSDPTWWNESHFLMLKMKSKMYLWPYLKAVPFQLLALYALIWLLSKMK
jgi:hypothetical protein